jgi:colicin import membrane protein
MEERIREAWAWAGADDSLECVVRFSVAPDGAISSIRTTRSSGDPAYDNSAARAVQAVNPLRPIPEEYRNEFGDVELTFRARDLKR